MNRASNSIGGFGAGVALSGAAQTQGACRELQIPESVSNLLDAIDSAENLLGSIGARLGPVALSEAPTDAKSLNEVPRPIRCELAEQITDAAARVASLNSRMRSLLDRLEI